MNDTASTPVRSRGVPTWAWGCAGAALLSLAAFIGFTWYGLSQVMKAIGPEVAWPVVAEVLPYGESPPPRYQATLIDFDSITSPKLAGRLGRALKLDNSGIQSLKGQQVILLQEQYDSNKPTGTGSMALLWRLPAGADAKSVPEPLVFQSGEQAEASRRSVEISLQGRTVQAEAYATEGHKSPFAPNGKLEILEVDLTDGRARPLILKLLSSGDQRADGPELERFLAPFDVWQSP